MKKSYVQLCLRHNWGQAVLAEGSVLCVQAALRLLEMATLAVLGTPTGVAWYPDPLGRDALIQGVVLLAAAYAVVSGMVKRQLTQTEERP